MVVLDGPCAVDVSRDVGRVPIGRVEDDQVPVAAGLTLYADDGHRVAFELYMC